MFVGDFSLLLVLLMFGEFDWEDKFVVFGSWVFFGDVGEGGMIFGVFCRFWLKYNCIVL